MQNFKIIFQRYQDILIEDKKTNGKPIKILDSKYNRSFKAIPKINEFVSRILEIILAQRNWNKSVCFEKDDNLIFRRFRYYNRTIFEIFK